MRQIKIVGLTSDICWWRDATGQICPVLDIYEPTGYIKIRIRRTELGFDPYDVEGWISPDHVEFVE